MKKNHPTSASASADPATMLADPVVQNLLSDEIISACASLKSYERPHAWVSITEPFTQVILCILKILQLSDEFS